MTDLDAISVEDSIELLTQTVHDLIRFMVIRKIDLPRSSENISTIDTAGPNGEHNSNSSHAHDQNDQGDSGDQSKTNDGRSSNSELAKANLSSENLDVQGDACSVSNSNEDLSSASATPSSANRTLSNNLVLVSPDNDEQYRLIQSKYTDINFKRQKLHYDFGEHLLDDQNNPVAEDLNNASNSSIDIGGDNDNNHNNETETSQDDNCDENDKQSNAEHVEKNGASPLIKFAVGEKDLTGKNNNTNVKKFTYNQNRQLFKKFNLKTLPKISINDYIRRLQKYLKFSGTVLIASSYYIYKLIYFVHQPKGTLSSLRKSGANSGQARSKDSETASGDSSNSHLHAAANAILSKENSYLELSELNSYRILLTTLRIAGKLIEDLNHSQKFYAQVSGIKKTELSKLETIMLFLLNFDLKVDKGILEKHMHDIKDLHKLITDNGDAVNQNQNETTNMEVNR